MKVLVTGATGFVGREILRHLHAAGHRVRIIARNPASKSARQAAADFAAEVLPGDIQVPASLLPAMEGRAAVLHLVGIISEAGESSFQNVHVKGTGHLLKATATCGVRRFIHMSALGTRPNAVSRYHQTKWAAEELVRTSALESTIFRPSLVYGPEDHFVNLFANIARWSPVIPVVGKPAALFQPVPVECVARAFIRALDTPESAGRTFDLCGSERLTLHQIVDEILLAMGRKRLKLIIPGVIARIQAGLLETVFANWARKPSPLNRDQLLMLQEDNVGDPEPARRLFDLKPGTFREGIRAYLGKTPGQTSMP